MFTRMETPVDEEHLIESMFGDDAPQGLLDVLNEEERPPGSPAPA